MGLADPAVLARLRRRIRTIETGRRPSAVVSLGAPDAALPWGGLPLARAHRLVLDDESALGFVAVLLGRLNRRGPVLWCRRRGRAAVPFLPGLAAYGVAAESLILVEGGGDEVLWAMEEGLRCPSLGAVAGEVERLDLTAGRRLQLAAEAGGVTALVLASGRVAGGAGVEMSAGMTTGWRIAAAPAAATPWGGLGAPRWRVRLERCGGWPPAEWLLERQGDAFVAVA